MVFQIIPHTKNQLHFYKKIIYSGSSDTMRSDEIKKGFTRAPHRSLLRATGAIKEESDFKKPFIAVANSYTDFVPGHVHLEKVGKIVDSGKFQVVESNNNEILIRLFPEANSFNANKYKFKELVRFTRFPGDNVPFIIGLRIIDYNTVESFSYVRDFEKDKMVKKDDNAIWKRISEIPKK